MSNCQNCAFCCQLCFGLINFGGFPPDLPSSITELSLDYNKITKVEEEDFKRYKNLQRYNVPEIIQCHIHTYTGDHRNLLVCCRLGLCFNQIRSVENGSLSSIPNIREINFEHNRLKKVPPGLDHLSNLQVTSTAASLSLQSLATSFLLALALAFPILEDKEFLKPRLF